MAISIMMRTMTIVWGAVELKLNLYRFLEAKVINTGIQNSGTRSSGGAIECPSSEYPHLGFQGTPHLEMMAIAWRGKGSIPVWALSLSGAVAAGAATL